MDSLNITDASILGLTSATNGQYYTFTLKIGNTVSNTKLVVSAVMLGSALTSVGVDAYTVRMFLRFLIFSSLL